MTNSTNDEGDDVELVPDTEDAVSGKVVSMFNPKHKRVTETEENNDYMEQGLKAFRDDLTADARGFLAIVFDKDYNPKIIWTGDLNIVPTLGALKLAEHEFLMNSFLFSSENE